MSETRHANGYLKANTVGVANECQDDDSFLFSSESVGEGHPGKNVGTTIRILFATLFSPLLQLPRRHTACFIGPREYSSSLPTAGGEARFATEEFVIHVCA